MDEEQYDAFQTYQSAVGGAAEHHPAGLGFRTDNSETGAPAVTEIAAGNHDPDAALGVVAGGDNFKPERSSQTSTGLGFSVCSVVEGQEGTSATPGGRKRRSASSADAARDRMAKESFSHLAELGREFSQLGSNSISVRNCLICDAVELISSPGFDGPQYCKAAKIRRTSRTPIILAILRGALGKPNRKLASKWATGALELSRTITGAAAVASALVENGLEFYVKASRTRAKLTAGAHAGVSSSSTSSPKLVLRGAPPTLHGRVTLTLDLHDNVAQYVGTVSDEGTGGGDGAGEAASTDRG